MSPAPTRERPPYAVAARDLLRSTLLDAARDELRERSWSAVTMADVAVAAGVSRQTLYNEFGTRDEFAQALVLREADRFLVDVERALLARRDDPAAALTAAFDVFLTAAGHHPVVRAVILGESEDLLALVTTQGEPLVERAAARLAGILRGAWPQVAPADAELLAECLVRLAISYAALPKAPASTTAASVTTLLGPYLERVVAGGG